MIDWKQMHEEHKKWVRERFPGEPSSLPALGMVEEVGEAARALLKKEQARRHGEEPRYAGRDWDAEALDAAADVTIYLSSFCISLGAPFGDLAVMAENRYRLDGPWPTDPCEILSSSAVTTAHVLHLCVQKREVDANTLIGVMVQMMCLTQCFGKSLGEVTEYAWADVRDRPRWLET